MSSSEPSFVVERTVVIAARRETVFRFFTDSARFALVGRGLADRPAARRRGRDPLPERRRRRG